MLKTLICIAILILPVWTFAVTGPQDVSETAHNLAYDPTDGRNWSSQNPSTSTGTNEICIFCHTPHNAGVKVPLWNRYSTAANKFLMYTSSTSLTPTVKNNDALSADSVSRLCLSCHDGTTAINALINTGIAGGLRPLMEGVFPGNESFADSEAGYVEGEGVYLGTNLVNMHPINFNYADAQLEDNYLKPVSGVLADLKLFGPSGRDLECPTCHDPHVDYGELTPNLWGSTDGDPRYAPFLRKPNVSSALCLTCHDK